MSMKRVVVLFSCSIREEIENGKRTGQLYHLGLGMNYIQSKILNSDYYEE